MVHKAEYLYPITKESFHNYANQIFAPLTRGESVTTVWVPMAGRRMHNKFLIENIDFFKKELPDHRKYLFVYVEPLDLTEESLSGYLRLMAKSFLEICQKHAKCSKVISTIDISIFDDENASYPKLLEHLKSVLYQVVNAGLEVVFFLGEFDELNFANNTFFNNLKSLWSKFSPHLHYVFLIRERVTRSQNISLWGELNEVILQNIVYIPILHEKDFDYIIQRLSNKYPINVSAQEIKVLKELCGGHPYMLKVAFRVLNKHRGEKISIKDLEKMFYEHYELKSVAYGILDVRSENEKKVLIKVAKGDDIEDEEKGIFDFLQILGLIEGDRETGYALFGKLFEKAIIGSDKGKEMVKNGNGTLKLDKETDAIYLNGRTVEERFTRQEYSVLVMLLKRDNLVSSRDDIGEALWGKQSYEKYSDWAIDQLMSKLRKKLILLKTKDKLVTIRGKGYKLVHPSP